MVIVSDGQGARFKGHLQRHDPELRDLAEAARKIAGLVRGAVDRPEWPPYPPTEWAQQLNVTFGALGDAPSAGVALAERVRVAGWTMFVRCVKVTSSPSAGAVSDRVPVRVVAVELKGSGRGWAFRADVRGR